MVSHIEHAQDDVGGRQWATVAPGDDAKADPQADAGRGGGGINGHRKTSLTARPVRVHVGPAFATTTAAASDAAAVDQREPIERHDPQLVPARPHHSIGAEGNKGTGRRVLHVRVPVDAVLCAQPVAVRVP